VVVTDDRVESVLGPATTTFDEAVERALREEGLLPDAAEPPRPGRERPAVEGE
jgi:hypothetical protein